MPGLYCWFRTATYLGYSVMLCVFSLFLILVFEILVPYIFDVVCHSHTLKKRIICNTPNIRSMMVRKSIIILCV